MKKRKMLLKKYKKEIFIVTSFCLLGVLLLVSQRKVYDGHLGKGNKVSYESEGFGIYKEVDIKSGGVQSIDTIHVKSWLDDAKDIVYLFIPKVESSDKSRGWKYYCSGYRDVVIDGQNISHGDDFVLENGDYELVLDEHKEYLLRVMRSDNISTLYLELEEGTLGDIRESKDNIAQGRYLLLEPDKDIIEHSGIVKDIHARGNLSFTQTDKKSFSIKTEEDDTLLGMDKSNTWLLIANSFDSSLSRNYVASRMAEVLDVEYTVEADYIDLYIDGEYQGNYQLSEKVEIADGRIEMRNLEEETEKLNLEEDLSQRRRCRIMNEQDIPMRNYVELEYEPADNSNGYLLELDMFHRYEDEASGFLSNHGQPVVIKSPEFAGKNQVEYIADRYQQFENALCSANGYNEQEQLYYYDYMDAQSFAKKYLIDEVTKNTDSSLSSFYIRVPYEDGKFYAGPIWDYDKSLGANEERDIYKMYDPIGFYASENLQLAVTEGRDYSLYYLLCNQKDFRAEYIEMYYNDFRDAVLAIAEEDVTENAERIKASAIMNALRWNVYEDVTDIEEIEKRYLQDNEWVETFLQERIAFLDREWR